MTRTRSSIALVSLILSSPCLAQHAVQWRVEDGGNGHWYQWFQQVSGRDWTGWRAFSRTMGGHLAVISTDAENAFVTGPSVFQGSTPATNGAHARIGAFQPTGSGEPSEGWQWDTGEPFEVSPSRWFSLEDCCGGSYCGGDGEDSAAVVSWAGASQLPNLAGKWNDVGKCLDWWGAVVEWSADCNGDGIVDFGQCRDGSLPDTNGNNVPDCCEGGPACCIGDLNGDSAVDGADLGILLNAWGACGVPCAADLNRDGFVDGSDLGTLLGNWGACP